MMSLALRFTEALSAGLNAAGTNPHLPRFPGMKVREENCNMVLLAIVAVFTVVIASGASLVGPADKNPIQFADRTRAEPAASADKRIIYVSDQPPVRVIGAPFVPNTNPRER
jgi:hypothetical protein